MIDLLNTLSRFENLKELANKNGGYIEPTLYVSEIEAIIKALEYYQLGDCMNDCEHYENCSNYIYSKGYNKAIDDLTAELIKHISNVPNKRIGGGNVFVVADNLKSKTAL